MSNSIRFLGAAILVWVAVRAVSLGMVPGTQALAFDARTPQPSKARVPAIQPTALPPVEPPASAYSNPQAAMPAPFPPYGYGSPTGFTPYPVYIPMPAAGRSSPPQIIYVDRPAMRPAEINVYGGSVPFAQAASSAAGSSPVAPERQSTPALAAAPAPRRLLPENVSLSSWAMMRKIAGSDSLASGGMLGGSQAGARLLWRFDPRLSASLRASAPINSQRGIEAAAGLRYQPFARLPVAVTLERRHAFRDYGQSAFALFGEGGVYARPMPFNSTLDAYFQGGVVDFNDPDWFVDGQMALTRPVWRNLSAGFGVWGGGQPGLHRIDVGPRASLRIGHGMRVHVDYRYMLSGNARPGSGSVLTLAGDF